MFRLNNKFNNLLIILIYVFTISISLILSFLLYSSDNLFNKNIILLPLSSIIINLFFYSNILKIRQLPVLIISALIYLRLNFLPYFFHITNYVTEMGTNSINYIDNAIFLTIYEAIILNLTIYLFYKTKNSHINKINKNKGYMFTLIVVILTIFALGTFILIPETPKLFKSILDVTDDDFTTVLFSPSVVSVGSIKRIFLTLFTVIFNLLRIIIPSLIIYKSSSLIKSSLIRDLITYFIILIQFFFITSTIAYTVFVSFVLFLFHAKINNKNNRYLTFIYGFIAFIIVGYFFARFSAKNTSVNIYLSNMLNAYFTGLTNVAGSYKLDKIQKFSVLISSIKTSIPFNNTIFGPSGYNINSFFNISNGVQWQISSTIGNGRYYFGNLFSPIFSIVLIIFSLKSYSTATKTTNPMLYVSMMFLSIIATVSIIMYNEQIFFSWFLSDIFPLILITKLYTGKMKER